jgi:hypothetical protein
VRTSVTQEDSAESIVRDYMNWLTDKTCLRDYASEQALEFKIAETKDPLDRLKLWGRLHSMRLDPQIEIRFIKVARKWAIENKVPASAFLTLGVKRNVLKRAGIIPTTHKGAPRARTHSSPTRKPRTTSN